MKAKIRIIEGKPNGSYAHLNMQILKSKKGSEKYPDVIGTITFMRNIDTTPVRWFGMRYVIETDKHEFISEMAALAKFIYENSYHDIQPEELKHLLQAEVYIHHECNFIPISSIGMRFYKLMQGEKYMTYIIAPNDIVAQKKAGKEYSSSDVKFSHIIENTDF